MAIAAPGFQKKVLTPSDTKIRLQTVRV